MIRLGLALALAGLVGCSAPTSPVPTPRIVELPRPQPVAGGSGCAGAAPEVTVRLDPASEPPAWFEFDGGRLDVLWPPGYRLLEDPIVVIDPQGRIVLRDGDRREVEVCATGDDGVVVFHGAP
ncbi:MAG TPA: hypothetical protein VGZ51_05105 [Actinomycetota bacterium]|nr:hypothetical protein [Actinomycetota bacterium]